MRTRTARLVRTLKDAALGCTIFHLEMLITVPLIFAMMMDFQLGDDEYRQMKVTSELTVLSMMPMAALGVRSLTALTWLSIYRDQSDAFEELSEHGWARTFNGALTYTLRGCTLLMLVWYWFVLASCFTNGSFCLAVTWDLTGHGLPRLVWFLALSINILVLLLLVLGRPAQTATALEPRRSTLASHQRAEDRLAELTKCVRETTPEDFAKVEEDSCVICLGDFEAGELVRELVCNHLYHDECIRPWILEGRGHCPLRCRIRADASTAPPESVEASPNRQISSGSLSSAALSIQASPVSTAVALDAAPDDLAVADVVEVNISFSLEEDNVETV